MKARILSWLRVTERPQLPPGDAGEIECFRAAPGFLRYSVLLWGLRQAGALLALLVSLAFFGGLDGQPVRIDGWDRFLDRIEEADVRVGILPLTPSLVLSAIESTAILTYCVQLVFSGLFLKLAWELRWYMVGDESLRIREGLWQVREQTMTIANIQNMVVRQGPLQRFFGVSDLVVHTAGGGSSEAGDDASGTAGSGKNFHVGHLRGLTHPRAIRERIRRRNQHLRDAGGDRTPPSTAPPGGRAAERQSLARELVAEVRALRRDLAVSRGPD